MPVLGGASALAMAVALAMPGTALSNPPTHSKSITQQRAVLIAKQLPRVSAEMRLHPDAHWDTSRLPERWRVQLWTSKGELVAEVFLAPKDGKVLEQWTGYQAAWSMARGYPGAFGHSAAALWVWLPLLAAFLIGLLPRGRPDSRWLDVAAVAALSIPFAAFNRGRIDLSTPLIYPPLLWLAGRMLFVGVRAPKVARKARKTLLPAGVMLVGIVFLIGFRTALVIADGNVIDVGEASVIGGDRLVNGKQVYGHFPKRIERGDTYGPSTWAAYAPFAVLFDANSHDGRLAAAVTAAIVFDLICIALLAVLAMRLRGPPAAVVAVWFWVTCPVTLYIEMCAANDTLVAAATVLPLLAATASAGARGGFIRGAAAGLSALVKFAGLALIPLYARARGSSGLKAVAAYGVGLSLCGLVMLAPYFEDLNDVWNRTIGYQDSRGAPFSAWGLYGLPNWSRTVWEVLVLVLALGVSFVPKAQLRNPVALAALSVPVLIGVELSAVYWFYTYLVWFLPAIAIVVAVEREPEGVSRWWPGAESAQSGLVAQPLAE